MKNLLFACLFIISSVTLNAQDNSTFKKETVEFLKITGAGAAFENAIDQLGAMVSAQNKETYTKEANATLIGLYGQMAELYMSEFTQDEIKTLNEFYHTDLGKKLASKQFALTQKAMLLGQNWGMEVQSIAQKYQ